MRYQHFVLACTLLQQGQPFAPPLCVRKQSAVLRASSADDNTDENDADEAARIAEMRKRMEGMFSGAEAEAAPATEDAPAPAAAPKPPRLGRGTPRWTPPKRRAVTKAQDAEPFTRREVRGGRDVVQERRRNDDNIPGLVNFASDPRTFAAGGAIVALSFVLYVYAFLSGGINDGTARYAGDPETMGSGFDFFASEPDDRPGERVWI
ncbi:unnamed protein product [Pelagomonas calceolata]|uniref:Transmembrane protein n=1 Tax=Pelagomonas calceolata TaxID=35677 RepID=A0A8J2SS58_9STRA|nr:unnamed protein product [Pelagomonas calceolata]